jgi:molecular chaperone HscB
MNLTDDDFTLFGLAPKFSIDRAALDACWRQLQARVHPDRFAADGHTAQRLAMQWSVRINEAYRRLRDPLTRAAYLCELRGAPIDAEKNTAMPAQFLVEQMEWRESLDEANTIEDVDRLDEKLALARQETLQRIARMLDEQHDAKAAAQQVRALMFIERFGHDVQARAEQLGQ